VDARHFTATAESTITHQVLKSRGNLTSFCGAVLSQLLTIGLSGERTAPHFSFEPFPKYADLSMKRADPYPPLPKRKPRFPQAGFSLFVRGMGARRPRHERRWPLHDSGKAAGESGICGLS
jgi:hypothetical protein